MQINHLDSVGPCIGKNQRKQTRQRDKQKYYDFGMYGQK